MFIRTSDRDLLIETPSHVPMQPKPPKPAARRPYPLRIAARIFAVIGAATALYAITLIGMIFHSGILVF